MEFYSKYELIDPLPGGGSRSFRGRQTSTSREVLVHLLPGGASAENQALLARLRSLSPRAMAIRASKMLAARSRKSRALL